MEEPQSSKRSFWRRRNWWKIGFFIMLFAFEFTREIAVIQSDPAPKVATSAFVGTIGGYTSATGRWVRIDGGSEIVPSATHITCVQEEGTCVEATAHMYDGYLSQPDVDTFKARFSSDAVSYENDQPQCARYSVRIDLKLKKVFAVRERVTNPTNEICQKLEDKVEMTLGDGYQKDDTSFDNHFVPILSFIRLALN